MRHLFTTANSGLTMSALKWGESKGQWRRIRRGIYGQGPQDPSPLDRALAAAIARGEVASNCLAGVLHELDGVTLGGAPTRRRSLPADRVTEVEGVACTSGLQTLLDLAAGLDDLTWEQALESALRKRLVTIANLDEALPAMSAARSPGIARIRRVLALRPPGAAPTESLLETLMVQLARTVPAFPELVRQHVVLTADGEFVARLDLSRPSIGLFLELDGQHHKDQPVYDARRETAVVAATGWLPGRFTWHEVVRLPNTTRRRLAALAEQARRRSGSLEST